MRKTLLLSVVALASTFVAGCASVSSVDDGARVYNDKMSRAKNLVAPWGITSVRDVKAPEDAPLADDGSLLFDAAGWASSFHAAAGSGFLPGTGNWGSALGLGLGVSLLSSALGPATVIERTFAMGYVPQTSAPTFGEARLVFGKAWSQAMESTLKDLFPKATIKVENADYKDVMLIDGLHVEAVTVVDESMGCFDYDVKRPREDHCTISLNMRKAKEVVTVPPAYFGERSVKELSYRIPGAEIDTLSGQKNAVNWTNVLSASVKYLPENMIIFAGIRKNEDGKKTPPMVLEKDRINFFVRPAVKKD